MSLGQKCIHIKKNENFERTLIPHSQVTGQVELDLLDEKQLEHKDASITVLSIKCVKIRK